MGTFIHLYLENKCHATCQELPSQVAYRQCTPCTVQFSSVQTQNLVYCQVSFHKIMSFFLAGWCIRTYGQKKMGFDAKSWHVFSNKGIKTPYRNHTLKPKFTSKMQTNKRQSAIHIVNKQNSLKQLDERAVKLFRVIQSDFPVLPFISFRRCPLQDKLIHNYLQHSANMVRFNTQRVL